MRKGQHQGFTLTELLAVMGVTAALAALVIPAANSVLENGRAARCISNLKQCSVALRLYANDHEMTLPPPVRVDDITTWNRELLDGYLSAGDADVFVCPSYAPFHYRDESGLRGRVYGLRAPHSSLVGGGNVSPATARHRPLNLRMLEEPSRYPLLGDTKYSPAAPPTPSQWYVFFADQVGGGAGDPALHARHNGRVNMGFADGSVRALVPKDLNDPALPSSRRFRVLSN